MFQLCACFHCAIIAIHIPPAPNKQMYTMVCICACTIYTLLLTPNHGLIAPPKSTSAPMCLALVCTRRHKHTHTLTQPHTHPNTQAHTTRILYDQKYIGKQTSTLRSRVDHAAAELASVFASHLIIISSEHTHTKPYTNTLYTI